MGFANALATEQACHEGSCETVACAHSVNDIHLWCRQERFLFVCEDIAAFCATSENEHRELVVGNELSFVLAKHRNDDVKFLVVYLQDVATAQGLFDDVARIELLAKVDVEYFQAVFTDCIKEALDGGTLFLTALSQ